MESGEAPMPTVANPPERRVLIRDAFRLEWLSVAWGHQGYRRDRRRDCRAQSPARGVRHHSAIELACLSLLIRFGFSCGFPLRFRPGSFCAL